jgi:uncharacterized protein
MNTSPSSGERIAVVDVLRAFALLGIIATHSAGGYLAGPPPAPDYNVFGPMDRLIGSIDDLLTFGKFFSIFAFLFGLSFAIQMENADRKGQSFAVRFAWRLALLFAIGFIHNLFYSGDILTIYALLGLLLIPWRRVRTGVLLVIAMILVLNLPGLAVNLAQLSSPPTAEQRQAAVAGRAAFVERARQQYEIKSTGSAAELIEMNASQSFASKFTFQVVSGRLWITFGLFLLGLCAGRMSIFRDTEEHRRFFRRLAWIAGGVAATTTAIAVVQPFSMRVPDLATALGNFSFSVQQFSLAAFYLCVVTLLFWRNPSRGVLPALAPMGKMGLTTYLTQSVFGLAVFYGIGLGMLGKIGVAWSVALGLGFFVVQVFVARWWLQHFAMGPVEWLWRTLTYFRLQPIVRPGLAS